MREFSFSTVLSALIIGGSLLGTAWLLPGRSPSPLAITASGANATVASVSVSGEGKVMVNPDMFVITFLVEEKAKTTKEAFDATNAKVAQVKKLLTEQKVAEKDIQTTSMSIYPNYDYSEGGEKPTMVGFVSQHGLTVRVRDLANTNGILSIISTIDGVQIQNTYFDLEDKTAAYSEARGLAIKKASQKASDIEKGAGVKLGKISYISESEITPYYPTQVMNAYGAADMSAGGGGMVSAGQLEVVVSIMMNYDIQ